MSPRRPLALRLAALFAAQATLLAVISCGGDGNAQPSPSPEPTPVNTVAGTVAPTPPAPETPWRLIYREYGPKEDVLWRVLPADPSQREKLAAIPHREGHGVIASLSPDGRMLAYLLLPESARSEDSSQAEVHVLDLKKGKTVKVVDGVDYRFRPLWSPDSQLLFFRRYAGPEILSSEVSILYTKVVREPLEGEPTATPTPTPSPTPTPLPPDQTPAPTPAPEDPVKTMMKARYSQVRAFTPLGFADDGRSLFFVQVNGGLEGTTLVGKYAPATTGSIAEAEAAAKARAEAEAALIAAGVTPDPAASPTPTPTPNARFVVNLTDQEADGFSLSPDGHKVAYRAGGLVEGEFRNLAYVADLIQGTVYQAPSADLPQGDHLGAAWHPNSTHLSLGVAPASGQASPVGLIDLAGAPAQFFVAPAHGYDVPLTWAPDASWLAVTNWSGSSPANPGTPTLELVSPTGRRVEIARGNGYGDAAAVVGWWAPS